MTSAAAEPTEQGHRQDDGEEGARDTDSPEVDRQHVAADSQDEQEEDELDGRPVAGLRRREGNKPRCDQHDPVDP